MGERTFKLRFVIKCIQWVSILIMLISIFSVETSAQNSQPSDGPSESTQVLEEGETRSGPGFYSGNVVEINGTVDGTTFAAGREIQINGTINGDLFAMAEEVQINGEVTGNIYGLGQTVNVNSQTEGDAFLSGGAITIEPGAEMGRDVFVAGGTINQEGMISRHLFSGAQNLTVNGPVGGDTTLSVEQLTLEESAVIDGNLSYRSPNEATIASNSTVNGQVDWNRVEEQQETPSTSERILNAVLGMVWSILSALLVWFAIKIYRGKFWERKILPISEKPLKTFGVGLLMLVVTPIIVILALVSIIGIPLSLILAVLYAVSLYIAKIIVALFIGYWITSWFKTRYVKYEILQVLLGLIILELLGEIPVVGFILSLAIAIIGLGAIILSGKPTIVRKTDDNQT